VTSQLVIVFPKDLVFHRTTVLNDTRQSLGRISLAVWWRQKPLRSTRN